MPTLWSIMRLASISPSISTTLSESPLAHSEGTWIVSTLIHVPQPLRWARRNELETIGAHARSHLKTCYGLQQTSCLAGGFTPFRWSLQWLWTTLGFGSGESMQRSS
jgi:hypothetical protein